MGLFSYRSRSQAGYLGKGVVETYLLQQNILIPTPCSVEIDLHMSRERVLLGSRTACMIQSPASRSSSKSYSRSKHIVFLGQSPERSTLPRSMSRTSRYNRAMHSFGTSDPNRSECENSELREDIEDEDGPPPRRTVRKRDGRRGVQRPRGPTPNPLANHFRTA